MRDGGIPQHRVAPPQITKRLAAALATKQDESPLLDSLADLDLSTQGTKAITVNAEEDGFDFTSLL